MTSSTTTVGDVIEARCTKCRKNNPHTVIIVTDGKPDKVQCSVCERQHKYRPPTVPRKTAARKSVDPDEVAAKEWAAMADELKQARALDYSMETHFRRGNVIKHSLFGLGLVERAAGYRKVEVLFAGGRKIMRCG
jgi:hypothetical protein